MPLNPTGQNIQYYENGRAQARYNGVVPLATPPPQGTPAWWANTGTLDVWNGIPSRTGDEVIWRGNGGGALPIVVDSTGKWVGNGPAPQRLDLGGPAAGGTPPKSGSGIRPAPAYVPKTPNPQGQVYLPPPPVPTPPVGSVSNTVELFGVTQGRKVPLNDILYFDGSRYTLKRGVRGSIAFGRQPSEGYGYGGSPGAWPRLYPSDSPANFGLDPQTGVVAWDGRKVWAVPANTLMEIFGPTWRNQVYGS